MRTETDQCAVVPLRTADPQVLHIGPSAGRNGQVQLRTSGMTSVANSRTLSVAAAKSPEGEMRWSERLRTGLSRGSSALKSEGPASFAFAAGCVDRVRDC